MKISGRNGKLIVSENGQIQAIALSLGDAMRIAGIEPERLPRVEAKAIESDDDDDFSELLKLLGD